MQHNDRVLRWSTAIVYTALIFLITFCVSFIESLAVLFRSEKIGTFLDCLAPLVGVVALFYTLYRVKKKRIRSVLWLGAVVGGFAYLLLVHCVYPVDRLHLVQYSILAWIFHRVLKLDFEGWRAIAGAAALTIVVGAVDGAIAYMQTLPGSVMGDTEGIITNWIAGALGFIGLLAVLEGGYWNWHRKRRLGTRFCLGYVLPVLLVAVSVQQIWTRYVHPPMNLIILTVDSLRPDHMSAYGYERKTTPNIDSLLPDAALFEVAYSQSSWTAPGIVSTLTGLYPPAHGVDRIGHTLPESVETLLDGFSERGYEVPNLNVITDDPTFQNLGVHGDVVEGTDTSGVVSDWISAHARKPFAVWYHYRDLHLPYLPEKEHMIFQPALGGAGIPEKIRLTVQKETNIPFGAVSFTEEDQPWIEALWDAQVHQFDAWFEELRYRLSLHHILDNTLIIITSTHGESLLNYHELSGRPKTTPSSHFEETLRIPMIFYGPELLDLGKTKVPRVINRYTKAQQVDVLPTIYELMGWEIPEEVQGCSLLLAMRGEQLEPRPVYASSYTNGVQTGTEDTGSWVHSILDGDWKLIVHDIDGVRTPELYDLDKDPLENQSRAEGNQASRVNGLNKRLNAWLTYSYALHEKLVAKNDVLRTLITRNGYVEPKTLTAPTITQPLNNKRITYEECEGQVVIRWTGNSEALYVLELSAGNDKDELPPINIEIIGTERTFPALSEKDWDFLGQWNPYRVRVRPKSLPEGWSAWCTVNFIGNNESASSSSE